MYILLCILQDSLVNGNLGKFVAFILQGNKCRAHNAFHNRSSNKLNNYRVSIHFKRDMDTSRP